MSTVEGEFNIEFIEFWAGVPVQLVSLGPDRVDTIERHDPFG